MALLLKSFDAQVEECIHVQLWIPPLIIDGRKLKFGNIDIQGSIPPINFLIPDGDNLVKARFYPQQMRWELVEEGMNGT